MAEQKYTKKQLRFKQHTKTCERCKEALSTKACCPTGREILNG
jgi:hypothetical protein